ncbi:MAG: hypothetical protein KDE51_09665 [Anaerolineales bacterium]|nr:hypothetical protein [Anaerolineales bacterium]
MMNFKTIWQGNKFVALPSLFIVLLLALAGCGGGDEADLAPLTAAQMDQRFDSPAYAVHLSQWWDLGALERDLGLVQSMNFGWVKQKFAWRDIEGYEKGQYDWYRPDYIVDAAERYNVKLIVRIDRQPLWSVRDLPDEQIKNNQPPVKLQDFGDFCEVLAQRYRGRIAAYQVWNEPNLSREWGEKPPNPAEYTALLKVCYEGIKRGDPKAIVISAGLAPTGTQLPAAMPDDEFLQGMYAAGAADYFDVLGLNAPGYKAPPEISPDEALENPDLYGNGRWFVFRHVEDMRRIMVENDDAAKQVAILEMGWTTDTRPGTPYEWHAVSEAEQAEYLRRAYEYAQTNWEPWIGVMTTIFFADAAWSPDDEQYWWSIVLPDGTPRPAYTALKDMPK